MAFAPSASPLVSHVQYRPRFAILVINQTLGTVLGTFSSRGPAMLSVRQVTQQITNGELASAVSLAVITAILGTQVSA